MKERSDSPPLHRVPRLREGPKSPITKQVIQHQGWVVSSVHYDGLEVHFIVPHFLSFLPFLSHEGWFPAATLFIPYFFNLSLNLYFCVSSINSAFHPWLRGLHWIENKESQLSPGWIYHQKNFWWWVNTSQPVDTSSSFFMFNARRRSSARSKSSKPQSSGR